MVLEMPGQRLDESVELAAHPAPGHLRQRPGIALTGDQRSQHLPAGDSQDVADHAGQLDLGIFQQLLQALLLPGLLPHQSAAVTGQIPQPPDLLRVHQARAAHAPLGDLGQPHRVQPVGLGPPRRVLHMLGVQQPAGEPFPLEQVVHRLPIIAGGLHRHHLHPLAPQPIRQLQQRRRQRRILPHLLHPPARLVRMRHPYTRRQHGLAQIQRRDPLKRCRQLINRVHNHLPVRKTEWPPGEPGEESDTGSRARSNNAGPPKRLPRLSSRTASTGPQCTDLDRRPHPIFTPAGASARASKTHDRRLRRPRRTGSWWRPAARKAMMIAELTGTASSAAGPRPGAGRSARWSFLHPPRRAGIHRTVHSGRAQDSRAEDDPLGSAGRPGHERGPTGQPAPHVELLSTSETRRVFDRPPFSREG
jgi:hypothetical protein